MKNLYSILLAFVLCVSVKTFAQVPIYNSYPSAAATIFLDFDGAYVAGTSWNAKGPISCGPANMTDTQIAEVFNRVAEDYRPFDVNVTTDSTVFLNAPLDKRTRIILTVTNEWYGSSAGGVSYMGSFTWGDNTPAFVFTKLLGYSAKNVGEAASHEAGHTLGLRHQASYDVNCAKIADYNPGTGGGEIGWAPIMGVGYYRNFTLWNNGANPNGCTVYQNDLKVITSYNGFSYRPDDYTSDFKNNTTTQAKFVNNKFEMNGIIETSGDLDVVKFVVPSASRFRLNAVPYNLGDGYTGANLDMQVDLFNVSKANIATYNPATSLSATVDTILEAGTYYLQVQGKGNEFAPQYASLGSYTLQAQISSSLVLPVQKLDLHGSKEGNKHQLNWAIVADRQMVKQTVEVSTNGRDYQALAQPDTSVRSFSYVPDASGLLNYRLNVELGDGSQYYSNVVAIPAAAAPKPSLAGNLIQSTLSVNSPAVFGYQINDYSGRTIATGRLAQGLNNLTLATLSKGMYIIQFNDGQAQYSEKFMKQ